MSNKKQKIKVYNMTCASCEIRIERSLMNLPGVTKVLADYKSESVFLEYNDEMCNIAQIKATISKTGYSTEYSGNFKLVGMLIIVLAIILLSKLSNSFDMNSKLEGASYLVLFVVGVFTSLHCVGMCGGIMLSQSLSKNDIKAPLLYNLGRVVSYTILGAIIGAVGSVLSINTATSIIIYIIAGVFMIIHGANTMGFNIFRGFSFKLPFISKCFTKTSTSTPFLVGLLNGFMPCGPLQTMQLFALSTGSMTKGALSMFAFSVGTIPLMLSRSANKGE